MKHGPSFDTAEELHSSDAIPLVAVEGGWRDNLKRKAAFENANPDVEITSTGRPEIRFYARMIIDGKTKTFTASDLGTLMDDLEPVGTLRAAELGRIKDVWGDHYDHVRIDADGMWRGRRRTGDGHNLEAVSAEALDAVFRIIYLYLDALLPVQKVAAKTGISVRKVRRTLDSAGVPRHWGISSKEAAAIAKAVVDGGMTRAQAAEKFGKTPNRIGRALSKQGVVLVPDKDHLRAADAALVAGTSTAYLGELARSGKVTSIRGTARGHRLYLRADLEKLAARKERRPGARRTNDHLPATKGYQP